MTEEEYNQYLTMWQDHFGNPEYTQNDGPFHSLGNQIAETSELIAESNSGLGDSSSGTDTHPGTVEFTPQILLNSHELRMETLERTCEDIIRGQFVEIEVSQPNLRSSLNFGWLS